MNQSKAQYNLGRPQQRRSDEELQRLAKKYDFQSGSHVPKDFIQVLEKVFTNYVRSLTNTLSIRLETDVQVRMDSISQMKYLDYMLKNHGQTATCTFTLEPLKEPIYLNIDTQLAFISIDSICGGVIDYHPIDRTFTEIEKKLLESLSSHFLSPLKQSFTDYFEARYHIQGMKYDLFSIGSITDHESIILVRLDVILEGQHEFPISFIFSKPAMEAILDHISEIRLKSRRTKMQQDEMGNFLEKQVKSSSVEMSILLGNTTLLVSELKQLQLGDVIKLDQKVGELLPIVTEERTHFYVQPGTHHGNKIAVQVVEVVDRNLD